MSSCRATKTRPSQSRSRRGAKLAARRRQPSPGWFWVVGFLVLVVVAGIGVRALRSSSGGTMVRPAHTLGPADGEVLGQASAPVTVGEYGDFQCPHCADFKQTVGPTIRQLVDQGKIRFVYHPIAFLGLESVAAANAATCAGDQGKFWPYHDLLFQQQAPADNSGFLSSDQLLRFGLQAGVTDRRLTTCVTKGTYLPWVQYLTDQASQRGVNATPTILVNGAMAPDAITVQGLLAAVNAATNQLLRGRHPPDSPSSTVPRRLSARRLQRAG